MNTALLRESILKLHLELPEDWSYGLTAETVVQKLQTDEAQTKRQITALATAGFLQKNGLTRPTEKGTRAPLYRATDKARQLYPKTRKTTNG